MLDIKRATSNDLFSETGRSMTDWGSIMTTLASIASNKCSDEKKHKQRLKAMPDLESVLGQMDQKYNPIMVNILKVGDTSSIGTDIRYRIQVKYAKALGDKSAEATRAAFLAILQRGDQDIIDLGKVDRQWAIEQVKSWSNVQLSKLRNIYAASRGIDLTPAYLDCLKTLDIDYEEDSLLELAAWCLALSHIFQTGNYAALESNEADKAHGLA